MLTPSQFAWECCNAGDFPPPIPKRGPRYGADAYCYLCGGETGGVGWHLKDVIGVSFTDITQALVPQSKTMCQACTATSKSEGWAQYVAAHPDRGLPAFFPKKDGGASPRALNWLYHSHLFALTHHECPDRKRWREILLSPPAPPFVAVLAASGKKQLIFKAKIADSSAIFPIQFEDESPLIQPSLLTAALADFERLYALGFSKDSILSGRYHSKSLLDVGPTTWKEADEPAQKWRQFEPQLWGVCHFIASRATDG